MAQPTLKEGSSIPTALVEEVRQHLVDDRGIRQKIGDLGLLNIDRPLPFLCLYRAPQEREDYGTRHLILSEASYLVAEDDPSLSVLVEGICKALSDKFGACLVVEVQSAVLDRAERTDAFTTDSPVNFRILVDESQRQASTVKVMKEALENLEIPHFHSTVEIADPDHLSEQRTRPLLSPKKLKQLSCLMVGLEISPVYRDPDTEEIYTIILRNLRRNLSKALQKTFFEFVGVQTSESPAAPQMLGRRKMVDAVWSADALLAELSEKVNYLTAVTPVNSGQAFREFEKGGYRQEPVFHYRLLTIDPEDLKRRLYTISFDDIEDPLVAYLLRDKRMELDRQITLIADRNTPQFLYESLQLFPPVEEELLLTAQQILSLPKLASDSSEKLDAHEVARLVRDEIAYYKSIYPQMTAQAEVREDLPTGLMVSNGDLTIGYRSFISKTRIQALIQHEVGTHCVTYYNGRSQPLKLLYSGLPGYEELQEGLAVLAEYLVGGLSFARMRTLAARVVAVRGLTLGKTFVEVFHELRDTHQFSAASAFNISMRVFRGGGLSKDAVYLRGLIDVLQYFRCGGDIETLFIGKMGLQHVSVVRELQQRGILRPSPLTPRYMTFPATAQRLASIQAGLTVFDLF